MVRAGLDTKAIVDVTGWNKSGIHNLEVSETSSSSLIVTQPIGLGTGCITVNAFACANKRAICTERSFNYAGSKLALRSVTDFKVATVNSVEALMDRLVQQPVTDAIEVFGSYSGSVRTLWCGTNLGHGVLAVEMWHQGQLRQARTGLSTSAVSLALGSNGVSGGQQNSRDAAIYVNLGMMYSVIQSGAQWTRRDYMKKLKDAKHVILSFDGARRSNGNGAAAWVLWIRNKSGEFKRISHGGKVLMNTTAMTAEREALRMGDEYLAALFPVEENSALLLLRTSV